MSIRKRVLRTGKVSWYYDYKDQAGERRGKSFATKAEAIAFETRTRGEIVAGTHVADSASITVAEAADMWVAAGAADGLEQTTVRQRRQHADLHIKPLLGATRLSRLTAPAVQEFVNKLKETRSRAM